MEYYTAMKKELRTSSMNVKSSPRYIEFFFWKVAYLHFI